MSTLTQSLADESATVALAQRLAAFVRADQGGGSLLLTLDGPLGTGKSTLARAMLRALGVTGPVRSPTYTLVEPYDLEDGTHLSHLDLYRLGEGAELEFVGYFDERRASRLMIVEWARRVPAVLEEADLALSLHPGPGLAAPERIVSFRVGSDAGRRWLAWLGA